MELSAISQMAGDACYAALALVALWGAYCAVVVWRRAAQLRFRSEHEQTEFIMQLESHLGSGDFEGAASQCQGDTRITAYLAGVAIENRQLGFAKVKHLVTDLFQRDVLADLEYRMSWVTVVIKTAPMLGLFGTVLGMMSAFAKLSSGDKVDPTQLADDISLALITTAIGLAIAIPLTLVLASINIQLRKLEDLVGHGLTRFLDAYKSALAATQRVN